MDYFEQLRSQQTRFFETHKELDCKPYTESELQYMASACAEDSNWEADRLWPMLEFNLTAGQVRRSNTTHLLGSVKAGHFVIGVAPYTDEQTWIMRSHIILRNGSEVKKQEHDTADHIDPSRPFDDRLDNLRWASRVTQSNNRRKFRMTKDKQEIECSNHEDFSFVFRTYKSVDHAAEKLGVAVSTLKGYMSKKQPRLYHGCYWRTKRTEAFADEVWLPLDVVNGVALESTILVSNKGRINTMKDISNDGRKNPRSISNGSIDKVSGYMIKLLRVLDGPRKVIKMHIAVCEAFHGPRPSSSHTVDHINRIKTDNSAENLRWATKEEQASNRKR